MVPSLKSKQVESHWWESTGCREDLGLSQYLFEAEYCNGESRSHRMRSLVYKNDSIPLER